MDKRSSISDAEGRDWVTSLRDKWRLQILSRRTRKDSDGTTSEVPARIRRFVEGIPWGHVKPAMDALLAAAPYTGVIANGIDFGEPYRPTITTWQRDAQSAVSGAARPDATYTLIQDLVAASDRDGYAVGSSSSCSEEVVADYVWDAPGVEELPKGEQGVTYSIAAVHRNDDGTFDYQVVKRVAKTQHVEPVVVKDDMQSVVTQELWDNVYVLPDGSYADETKAPLSVPAAGVSNGVSTRIEGLTENPDCTLKFQVVRESSKDVGSRLTCKETMFEHEHGSVETGKLSVSDHVNPAGGGHYEEVDGQLQPDGTFVVASKYTDEVKQVSGKDYRRTSRALVSTVTTRNTSSTAVKPSSVGARQSHEMTPGGLYNLTVTSVTPNRTPDSARCSSTVFEETDDAVKMLSSISTSAHFSSGKGKYGEIIQDMDEYGVVKRVTRTTTEKSKKGASKDIRKTTRATITTTVDRNVGTTASTPDGVGERQAHEMTPGGLYNFTKVTVSANGSPDSARKAVNAFEEVTDVVSMSKTIDKNRRPTGTGSRGTYGEVVQDMDEYGVVKTVDRTTTEKSKKGASKDIRKTTRATITTTVDRNVGTTASTPDGVGERQAHEMTPGGLYNFTKVTVSANGSPDSARKAVNAFEEVTDVVSMSKTIDKNRRPTGTGSRGTYGEVVQDMDEYGVVKTVDRTTTEKSKKGASKDIRKTTRATITTTVDRNVGTTASTPDGVGERQAHEMTPGGLYNLTTVTVSANGNPDSARRAVNAFEDVIDVVSMSKNLSPGRMPTGIGSGGRYGEVVQDMDEYGIVKTVDRLTTEKAKESASKDIRKTPRATITTTVDRNVGTTASKPGSVGERQAHEMTPGGQYNFTHVTVEANRDPDSARKAVNAFEEVTDVVSLGTRIQANKRPAATGSGGKYGEIVQDMDEYGVVKEVDRTTTEKPHEFMTLTECTLDGTIKTTVNRFQTSKEPETNLTVGRSVRNEKTPGGYWNQTSVELENTERGKLKEECTQTFFEHVHEDLDGKGTSRPQAVEHAFTKGEIVVKENVLTSKGSWNIRKVSRKSTKRERTCAWDDVVVTGTTETKYKCFLLVFRNWDEPPDPSKYNYEHKALDFRMNEFGQYDGTLSCRTFESYAQKNAASPGTGGMTYSGQLTVVKGGQGHKIPFTIYRNASGVISTGFLANAKDYPEFNLHSTDTGSSGIKYG